MRNFKLQLVLAGFCLTPAAFAQQADAGAPNPGWRRVADAPPPDDQAPPPEPVGGYSGASLVLPGGTWMTLRVNEPISSDRNRPGDVFTATLSQPLVVNGYVVARRGQTVAGRVTEAQRAGRVQGTSRLGIELTEIALVDGQQVPVHTQLVQYSGRTSVGSDATAIGTATGLGAAVGAAADGGFGAGMGAIAGAAASTIGVLLTRGRATEIYPESEVTFRILDPVTIDTSRSEQAFYPVHQEDYAPEQPQLRRRVETRRPYPPPYWGGGWGYPYPYGYGYGYGYPGGWYGGGVVIITGRGHGGGRFGGRR